MGLHPKRGMHACPVNMGGGSLGSGSSNPGPSLQRRRTGFRVRGIEAHSIIPPERTATMLPWDTHASSGREEAESGPTGQTGGLAWLSCGLSGLVTPQCSDALFPVWFLPSRDMPEILSATLPANQGSQSGSLVRRPASRVADNFCAPRGRYWIAVHPLVCLVAVEGR